MSFTCERISGLIVDCAERVWSQRPSPEYVRRVSLLIAETGASESGYAERRQQGFRWDELRGAWGFWQTESAAAADSLKFLLNREELRQRFERFSGCDVAQLNANRRHQATDQHRRPQRKPRCQCHVDFVHGLEKRLDLALLIAVALIAELLLDRRCARGCRHTSNQSSASMSVWLASQPTQHFPSAVRMQICGKLSKSPPIGDAGSTPVIIRPSRRKRNIPFPFQPKRATRFPLLSRAIALPKETPMLETFS